VNKLPKSQQSKAKRALQEIWMAETKKEALAAFDVFVEAWGVKYDKAAECLVKDRDALLAFYDSQPSTGNICARRMRSTSLFCWICYFGGARATAWQRAGPEDVSPAAQPSPSLLIGGTRASFFRTTRLPSADELDRVVP
jgi:hypothetical protein